MRLRAALIVIVFSVFVPAITTQFIALVLRNGWSENLAFYWWPGIIYGVTALFTLRSAKGPLGFFCGTWFYGSLGVLLIGTVLWALFVPDWYYAPFVGIASSACAFPSVFLAALISAWIGRLPSMGREIRLFWGNEP